MKVTAALKKELWQWFETFWSTYLKGDIDTWSNFVREDYKNIGGTEAEIWNSKQEIIEYTNTIMDQFLGTVDIRNREIEVIPYGDYLMVHEFTDLYVKINGEWTFYAPFRMSSLMEKTDSGWITFHQHGSYPDMKALEGEAFSIDALKAENIRLQEGIKARTLELEEKNRELEIEAALERIRARSMAMQSSNELGEVILEVLKKLQALGISMEQRAAAIFTFEDGNKDYEQWVASPEYNSIISLLTPYFDHPVQNDIWEARENGTAFYAKSYSVEDKNSLFSYLFKLPALKDMPKAEKTKALKFKYYDISMAFKKNAAVVVVSHSGVPLTDAENSIIMRLSKVFDQTYTRFLDLQKAEKQTKEAKIEAALERIRASTMAMHKSYELAGVVKRINIELLNLNIHLDTTQILTDITTDPQKGFNIWIAVDGMDYLHKFHFPYLDHTITQSFYKNQEKQIAFYSEEVGEEEKNSYFELVFKYSDFKTIPKERQKVVFDAPGWTRGIVFLTNSILILSRYKKEAFNEEETEIFVRIGKVFEQAYTRFLDLQKAEEQAREAQIEASLERVRSASMAMHKSHELHEVIQVLFEQLQQLSFNIDAANFVLNFRDSEAFTLWAAVPGQLYPTKINMPFVDTPILNSFIKAKEQNLDFYADHFTFEEKNEFFEHFFNHVEGVTEDRKRYMLSSPGYARSTILLKNIALYILNYAGVPYSDTENSILKRFAYVFEQSYTRFLDLQKAEKQVRESQIEAALEKVRSRSLAMHKSNELNNVVAILFENLKDLEIPTTAVGIQIYLDNSKDMLNYVCGKNANGLVISHYRMPYFNNPIIDDFQNARDNETGFFVGNYSKKVKDSFYNYLFKNTDIVDVPDDIKDMIFNSTTYTISMVPESNSMIAINDFEGKQLSEDHVSIIKRFAKVFEQAYIRYQDLQKAEKQARESQIEASLERVRSKTMAMHSSQDVGNTMIVLFEELESLGIKAERNGILIMKENQKAEFWTAKPSTKNDVELLSWSLDMKIHDMTRAVYKAWEDKQEYLEYELKGAKLKSYYKSLNNATNFPKQINLKTLPPVQWGYLSNFAEGSIYIFTAEQMPEENINILNRFASVFSQTYRRYQDLVRANEQAREAQIEASLERVRAKAMAMHHTDDLGETIEVFYDQLDHLFDSTVVRCGSGLLNKENKNAEMFSASRTSDGAINTVKGLIDMQGHPLLDTTYMHWLEQKELYYVLKGNEISEYYKYVTGQVAVPENKGEDELHFYFPMFEDGSFYVVTEKPILQDELEVFRRFNSVLSLTYRRFNDLNKAEEQAREAQIEAALERIRSRSMAMHRTDELSEVILVLFKQFERLDLVIDACIIDIFDDTNSAFNVWIGTGTAVYPRLVYLPYTDHPLHLQHKNARQQNIDFYTYDEDKASKDKYFEHFYLNAKGIVVPSQRKEYIAKSIGMTGSHALGEHSCVGIWNYRRIKYSSEENDILKRVNTVFQQTYTRFLDLQKAEAREREAVKQASLDRVRGEIASMRNATDLKRITPLVWSELKALGVPFFRCGVMLVNEDTNILDFYLSNPEGKALAALHLDFDSSEFARNGIEHWRKNEIYIEYWDQEQFIKFMKQLMSQGQIIDATTYQGGEQAPTTLTLQFVPFEQGMVYVGSEEELSQDELDLVQALGKSLSVAYARYEDFTKLDLAKAKAEKALQDLKAVQEQLIQQEKLASLGQLTAGIAHEIQNPLNFVNNFSEVSKELLEEMLEDLKNGDMEEVDAIASDVIANLEKILHHGQRADGIVKGMLQHSRSNTGKKELTDINQLVDEYLRLAYHGLRAKDKSFNASLETDFDDSIEQQEFIAQDIGRVVLNLITNAFYACNQKTKLLDDSEDKSFQPTVKVSTKNLKNQLEISVEDNGNGIPKPIVDKIFQPFFTTKPTGEGTGLGLSLSYDIIKAHGGTLNVESEEGKGTRFTINLPVNS